MTRCILITDLCEHMNQRKKLKHSTTYLPRWKARRDRDLQGEGCYPSRNVNPGMSASSLDSHRAAGQWGAWSCQQLEMGWWEGAISPSCPRSCPCPDMVLCWADHGVLSHYPVLCPQLGIPILLSLVAQVSEHATHPRNPSLFFVATV